MSGIITLIAFLCTALIEVINVCFFYVFPETEIPNSILYPMTVLEYVFLFVAFISSVRGLFFKDSTSKKLKFIYVVASVAWLSEKVFETLTL